MSATVTYDAFTCRPIGDSPLTKEIITKEEPEIIDPSLPNPALTKGPTTEP